MILKPCGVSNCPALIPRGKRFCPGHKGRAHKGRKSTTARGYGGDWQRKRKARLAAHPACELCEQDLADRVVNTDEGMRSSCKACDYEQR